MFVTGVAQQENTWAGGAWSRREIRDCYGCCGAAAAEALCRAWQVTLVDPHWARNDHLRAALRAFAASIQGELDPLVATESAR
jgi:hypothetical protein